MVSRRVMVVLVIIVIGSIIGAYESYTQFVISQQVGNCPAIFAEVSFHDASGFSPVTHLSGGYIQLALVPNATGKLELLYSASYNITSSDIGLGSVVPVWMTDSTGGIYGRTNDITIFTTNIYQQSSHSILVQYTVKAGMNQSLYVIGFPSTCRSVFLKVMK